MRRVHKKKVFAARIIFEKGRKGGNAAIKAACYTIGKKSSFPKFRRRPFPWEILIKENIPRKTRNSRGINRVFRVFRG
jgi:hypothetical protein